MLNILEKHKILLFRTLTLMALIILTFSCSTKKNSFTRRAYHNLTAHYNVYWNGEEALKTGLEELDKKVRDNYDNILYVFNYGTKQDAQSLNQHWDRAIQKASFAIQKHSMVFGGEEKVKWIDDSYLLIGRSYFYKQEYISARRTFNFIMREYGKSDIRFEAMLWLAQTYNQTGEFEKAEPLLNLVSKDVADGITPYEVVQVLPQVYADHYIRQKKYQQAIDYLYEGIAFNPDRDLKTRMMFILAQVFQQDGDLARASELYGEVVKRNAPYEMAFRANINLARSYDTATGDSKMVTKLLTKMLKDEKNKDFRDQIYYALADIALKDADTVLGIEYLTKSVSSSTTNNPQKSSSALRLADIYFARSVYEKAGAYYDTSMMFLPKEYPNYAELDSRTKLLKEVVTQMVTISREDSLQRVAAMPEAERSRLINTMIQAYGEEQQRIAEEKRLEEEIRQQEQVSALGTPVAQGIQATGKWYFYNEASKSTGYSEFIRKWTRRKHEDLWRLSNKQATAYAFGNVETETDTLEAEPDSLTLAANDPFKKEFYLKDLPTTPEALAASQNSVKEAYFKLGMLYFDGLKDYPESRRAFEKLNERFPANDHELQALYYLYKTCSALNETECAAACKEKILAGYPDSDYAKILTDPQYFAKLAMEKNREADLYEETFKAYEAGQYYMVIARSDQALATFGDTTQLAPKFAYLKAVSVGKVDVLDSLVASLKRVISKYPQSDVKALSMDLLTYIARENPEYAAEVPGAQEIQEPEKVLPYKYNPAAQHLFLIVVDSREVRLNPLKVKISDFNLKYYSIEGYTVNSLVLDDAHYLVTVGNFTNALKASDYLSAIVINEYVYADLKPETFKNFIISTENYATFFKEKNLEDYQKFFEKNYTIP